MKHSFPAYAKINLGLRILEKRPDGYHNIETVFHRIDVFDSIQFAPSSDIHVTNSNADAPNGESNICYKAAKLLRDHLHVETGVHISITKRIPVGAGLGGGSSDAATVLRHLPQFWNRTVERSTLDSLAIQLGSDVPFFLGNTSAFGVGRGEQLEYFSLDIPYFILLCNPNIHVSTAWAYKNVLPQSPGRMQSFKQVLLDCIDKPEQLAESLRNDFETSVFREHPEISSVKEAMTHGGAVYASMSGSGSSVFGFFREEVPATKVMSMLGSKNYRTFLTQPHFAG
jgi:4-diphosphocytidyl-2-C-methyl-D-erythritol kinase